MSGVEIILVFLGGSGFAMLVVAVKPCPPVSVWGWVVALLTVVWLTACWGALAVPALLP